MQIVMKKWQTKERIEKNCNRRDMKTDITTIPNVGKKTKESLMNIGVTCVEDLKGKNPDDLYLLDSLKKGFQEDRCQLYLFRMAVYYAENELHDPEKLNWWYWKDKEYPLKEKNNN